MVLSHSRWYTCSDPGRSTGAYTVYYQGLPIDKCTHVPGPVSQSSAESEYNEEFTAVMALSHSIMLNN